MRLRKLTTLRTISILYITICVVYTILYWGDLSYSEGWGVVAMAGLIGVGIFGLILDKILRLIISDRFWTNFIGIMISIILAILVYIG